MTGSDVVTDGFIGDPHWKLPTENVQAALWNWELSSFHTRDVSNLICFEKYGKENKQTKRKSASYIVFTYFMYSPDVHNESISIMSIRFLVKTLHQETRRG